jgi:hypothetical protein
MGSLQWQPSSRALLCGLCMFLHHQHHHNSCSMLPSSDTMPCWTMLQSVQWLQSHLTVNSQAPTRTHEHTCNLHLPIPAPSLSCRHHVRSSQGHVTLLPCNTCTFTSASSGMVRQPVVHLRPSLRVERQRVGSVRLRQLRCPPVTLKPTLHAAVSQLQTPQVTQCATNAQSSHCNHHTAIITLQSSHCTAGMDVSASAWLVDITGPDWLTGCVYHSSSRTFFVDASSALHTTYFALHTRRSRTVVTRFLVSHLHLQARLSASKRAQAARAA